MVFFAGAPPIICFASLLFSCTGLYDPRLSSVGKAPTPGTVQLEKQIGRDLHAGHIC